MSPGRTVACDRSMVFAPSGAVKAPAGPTLSIRWPLTTMTWSFCGVSDRPSMSVPARITVTVLSSAPAAAAATNTNAAAIRVFQRMPTSAAGILPWPAGGRLLDGEARQLDGEDRRVALAEDADLEPGRYRSTRSGTGRGKESN